MSCACAAGIPDADGALVAAALDAAADRYGPVEGGAWDPYPVRCADALVDALSRELDDESEATRATIVVHVPETALHEGSTEPGAHLDADDGGIAIANETARKLACDSKVQALVVDGKCVPINFGRRTRTVPDRLFRLLKERDLHCRAPGCTRTRGLHAHHVVHWIDGGPTDLDNLVLLCSRHHTMLHEYGWTIRGKPAHSNSSTATAAPSPPADHPHSTRHPRPTARLDDLTYRDPSRDQCRLDPRLTVMPAPEVRRHRSASASSPTRSTGRAASGATPPSSSRRWGAGTTSS